MREYQETLSRFLGDGVLSDDEKQQLKTLQAKFNLTDADLVAVRRAGASNVFTQIASDQRITEDERRSLEAIIQHFGLELKDINFDQNAFNKYHALTLIDQGVLPIIEKARHDLNMKERCFIMGRQQCYANSSV